jgi:hypothetical protein
MDCLGTQERLLESFEGLLAPLEKRQLEEHISQCPECAQFAVLQSHLDLRLCEGISPPQLSSGFRAGLQARIAREQRERWPDWLPDVAFLAGSGLAIASCAVLLPLPVPFVLETGVIVTFLAYSLQTLLVSALEHKMD